MQVCARKVQVLCAVALVAVALGMDCPGGDPMGNTNSNQNSNGNDNTSVDRLFVVNNASGITSHSNPASNNGNVAPATSLPAGAATDIFQPRSLVVTKMGQLIVARQNGGLSIHDDALTATGNTAADRIVEGAATGLDAPIALAYDADNDRLFVGCINATDGILVFEDVSETSFNGNVAPVRMFNPADRSPSVSTEMTIDALHFDSAGRLFVSDSSGVNQNSSRILRYDNPGTASGETTPNGIVTSLSWGGIEDLFVDDSDHLYVVDDSEEIEVLDDASTLNVVVTPDRTITLNGSSVALRGIEVDSQGRGFAADTGNSKILILLNIASLTGAVDANASISGANTDVSAPRHMFIVQE
ncbi:MAG TPA: hypothetical protein P5081_15890 [Phycisphaerae bacterium]|nr:hypothetical protein [Phycisphaerae bacterium]HRW54353.1 hypothetical protein [Phycisphaerae bacterium]